MASNTEIAPPPSYIASEASKCSLFEEKVEAQNAVNLEDVPDHPASLVLAAGAARAPKKHGKRNPPQKPPKEGGPLQLVQQARAIGPGRQTQASTEIQEHPINRAPTLEVRPPMQHDSPSQAHQASQSPSPQPEQAPSKAPIQNVESSDNHLEPNNIFAVARTPGLDRELEDSRDQNTSQTMEIQNSRAAVSEHIVHHHHFIPGDWPSSTRFSGSGNLSRELFSQDRSSSMQMLEAPHRDQRNRIGRPARQNPQHTYREEVRQETLSYRLKILESVSWVGGKFWSWWNWQ